jgi:hypothetical protein
MNRQRHLTWAAVLAAASLLLPLSSVRAQPAAAPQKSSPAIDELDCRTLLRLAGEERGFTLIYLHGYVSGMKGQTSLSAQVLAEATDRVVDHCIDKPGDKLLSVFERMRAK